VPVEVGDEVAAGAVIARLDERDYELAVQQTRASLDRARAEARNASASYDRVRALYEEGNASRTELDNARAASEAAAAQFSATEKQLELAELQLDYCVLEAPVAGAIAEVRVEASENVAAGQIVARLTSGARSEVQFGVPEVLITQVREGDRARVTFDAIPGTTFDATITEVGIASSGAATTFPVTAVLDEPDERVRPGMAAEVSLSFDAGGGGERYIVPSVAVGEDRRGRYVFVVEHASGDTAVVRRKAVEVGDLTGDGLEVYSGLEDGDLVVTAGVNRLTDGDRVRLPDSTTP
jgi:RND family efflux transporter MFP subunit